MAMEINATLVVQAFNFFVAYLLFRTLLFKPALQALNNEKNERDHLHKLIRDREQTLEKTEEQKQEAWHDFQNEFGQSCPAVQGFHGEHALVEHDIKKDELTEQEIQQLAKDVQKAIVKKVQHGS